MTDTKVLRHEKKYYISYLNYSILKSMLQDVLIPDANGDHLGNYFVRSVYFDTITNDNYYDKMLGIRNRRKLRARLYDPKSDLVKLEIKEKDGDYLIKDTLTISKEDYKDLLSGKYDFFCKGETHSLPSLFFRLLSSSYHRPVITIDYDREAYVHPFQNIRINFDKNIRINQHLYDIFDPDLIMTPVSVEPFFVLEIKFNDFLPDWLTSLISTVTTTNTSYSKYCIGRYL